MADNKAYYQDPLLSQQPESDKNQTSGWQHMLRKALMTMCDVCLPAIVIAYDRTKNRATVRPLIQKVSVSDMIASRDPIYNVPLFAYGDSNYHISYPVAVGTKGWILVCDRDIELYKQSLKESPPNTYRAHEFADSWFLPDHMGDLVIAGEDSGAMVIQHASSNSRIAVDSAAVRLTVGGTKITIVDGIVTIKTDTVDIEATTTNVKGALNVTGQTTLSGGLTSTAGGSTNIEGVTNLSGATTIEGRAFVTHTHPDSHGGNTGPVN